jgi:hypothetical protein
MIRDYTPPEKRRPKSVKDPYYCPVHDRCHPVVDMVKYCIERAGGPDPEEQ